MSSVTAGADVFASDDLIDIAGTHGGMRAGLPAGGKDKKYKIQNRDTATYMDLTNSLTAEDTPVIGWENNKVAAATSNQAWIVMIKDQKNKQVTLKNVAAGTFARTPSTTQGANVVGSATSQKFELIETETGVYNIKVIDEALYFQLDSKTNGTNVKVQADNDKSNQEWVFILL